MIRGARDGRSSGSKALPGRILLALLALFAIFYIVSCVHIVRQSEHDEARAADAIVVFGAAEYAGRPSPIFRARLDHAYTLFEKNLAPIVIVSGGSGKDPKYTEGGVGRDYLNSKGIADRHLIAETQGANTSESAERVAVIMRANGWNSCIFPWVNEPDVTNRHRRIDRHLLDAISPFRGLRKNLTYPVRWHGERRAFG